MLSFRLGSVSTISLMALYALFHVCLPYIKLSIIFTVVKCLPVSCTNLVLNSAHVKHIKSVQLYLLDSSIYIQPYLFSSCYTGT